VACFGSDSPTPTFDAGVTLDGLSPPLGDAGAGGDATQQGDASDAMVGDAGPDANDATTDSGSGGTFPTGTVDFGPVDCGSAPSDKTYSFTNTGPTSITYSASIAPGSIFSVRGASSGAVAPGQTGSLTLAGSAVPTTATAGTAVTGMLTLTTNVPGYTNVHVPLQVTPRGGALTVTPATAGFGPVPVGMQAADIPLTVTNTGNAAVTLTVGAPTQPDFAVVYTGAPAGVSLAPGASLPGAAARFRPSTMGTLSATATLQPVGAMCASPSTSIAMAGSGTNSLVTLGPNPVDFGPVSCGQAATPASATINNNSNAALTYHATLGLGASSPYTIDAPDGMVAAGGHASVLITPKAIPVPSSLDARAFDDTLTVVTGAPVQTLMVSIKESPQGAVLALTMPHTDFGPVGTGSSATLPFSVQNTGNVDAPLTTTATGPGFSAAITGPATASADGGASQGTATFAPTTLGDAGGTIGVTTTAAQCGPAPVVAVSGTATQPAATFSGTPSFAVTCGGGAAQPQNVLVANNGTTPLVLSNVGSQLGYFTVVSVSSTTIAPGQNATISIAARAPVVGTDRAGTYDDNLQVTTNEPGNPTRTVPVPVKISGANLAFVDGNGTEITSMSIVGTMANCHGLTNYGIKNSGDTAVNVGYPTPGTIYYTHVDFGGKFGGTGATAPVNYVSVGAGATVLDTAVAHSGDGSCGGTDSFTFSVQPRSPVCIALPTLSVEYQIPANGSPMCYYCC
jgi:hypothetical protein